MKKIRSLISKIKAKATVQTYRQPLLATIVALLLVNLAVLVTASVIALVIDGDGSHFNGSFIEAFAASLSWMITPTSITKYSISTDFGVMILAAVVIGIEMILFSGAIIATLTAAVRSYIEKKSAVSGKIVISGHFVILNWNSRVPDMIYNLITKNYRAPVVILSDRSRDFVLNEISSTVSSHAESGGTRHKNKINLIIKQGSPLLHGMLEDISVENASAVVVMSRDDMTPGDDPGISNADLNAMKITLALGGFSFPEDCNIVIETDTEETRDRLKNLSRTIKSLSGKNIIPVSFNRKIGQIIGQTVMTPALADIYLELFSFDGFEFYSHGTETVEEYMASHTDAIPVIRYDRLFVLAEDESCLEKRRPAPYVCERTLVPASGTVPGRLSVFVIGRNSKHSAIMENLRLAAGRDGSEISVSEYAKTDTAGLIADVRKTKGTRKVLILSDDTVSPDSYDANVFMTLMALQSAFPERDELSFTTEILDPRNLAGVRDFNIRNAIISNRMISLLLIQMALNRGAERFYDGLLTSDSEEGGEYFDICVSPLPNVLDPSQDLSFRSGAELVGSFYRTFGGKMMLLGVNDGTETRFAAGHQDDEVPVTLSASDSLVYIRY